jgi:superfamily I DNA/RNA helicase
MIANHKKSVIRGRDIGVNLTTLVKKYKKSTSIKDFTVWLNQYEQREVDKLIALNKMNQVDLLQDKCTCIILLADGLDTVQSLIARIESIFSDEISGTVFSTVHKIKGQEADTVYLLNPHKIPHKMAVKSGLQWQLDQEYNLDFIARTRNKQAFYTTTTPVDK